MFDGRGADGAPDPAEGASCAVGGPGPDVARVSRWRTELAFLDRDRPDAERIDLVRELEDLKAAAAAAQAVLTADLDVSRRAERARAGVPAERRGRGIGAEVALARRVSPVRGGQHLGLATALAREMPCTLAALSAGLLSEWRATLLVRESACLSVADRRLFDERLCGDPGRFTGWGDRRLVGEAKRLAAELDASAVVRRNRRAESERCVSIRPAPDTMSYVTGLLPVAQGVAVHAALSREADRLRSEGDDRSRGQIMADTFVQRLTGQSHAEDLRLEVQLVMTDAGLLGGDEPAYVPGYGTVPAAWARELVAGRVTDDDRAGGEPTEPDAPPLPRPAAAEANEGGPAVDLWIRRLYTAPSRRDLVAMDSKARRAPAGLARFITARDRTCRTPWCDAPIRHIDHVRPHADGGPTTAANLQGLCEACNYAKQAPGWSARVGLSPGMAPRGGHEVVTTTPTGHRYRSHPPPPVGAPWEVPRRAIDLRPPGSSPFERRLTIRLAA